MTNPRLEKIYQEAGRLFLTKGYANTKMAEIAKSSGIAVDTMYSAYSADKSHTNILVVPKR